MFKTFRMQNCKPRNITIVKGDKFILNHYLRDDLIVKKMQKFPMLQLLGV